MSIATKDGRDFIGERHISEEFVGRYQGQV